LNTFVDDLLIGDRPELGTGSMVSVHEAEQFFDEDEQAL
jgi:hypothetical protein